jgi:hypothetical protein
MIIKRPRREEVAVGWRRLHNEELHNLHASPYTIRVYKTLIRTYEGLKPLERPRN